MYHVGEGVERDDDQAMKWYLKAACQGDEDAQLHAANMYPRKQDYDQAMTTGCWK